MRITEKIIEWKKDDYYIHCSRHRKRNCVVCITDKDGSILEETKYENTLQEAWFPSYLNKKYSNRKCHAVCESTNFLQVQILIRRNNIVIF